jgi:hypothetical protein
LVNGTTLYKSGENILIDHYITWNAHEFYTRFDLPYNLSVPPNARNIRGEILPAETISSGIWQAILEFLAKYCCRRSKEDDK